MKVSRPASSNLRLQHLFLPVALSQSGTVREASILLGRTQPAVTKMLQELEASLGVVLFQRGRLGAQATASGKAFVSRATAILNEWSVLQEELANLANYGGEILRIGATPITTTGVLPIALKRFRKTHANILVRVREASIHELLLALADGQLDCVLGRFSGELNDANEFTRLRHEPLYEEALALIASPDHALQARRRLTWKDLADADWVLPPPELMTRQIFAATFARAGLGAPKALYESSSFATSISFASTLDVLALVPRNAGRVAQAQGLVRVLGPKLTSFSAPISIVHRHSGTTRVLSDFLTAVRAAAKAHFPAR